MYLVEEIRNVDGTPHERHRRRVGQAVDIYSFDMGKPLLYFYAGTDQVVTTTTIRQIVEFGGKLFILTRNSVYVFREVDACARCGIVPAADRSYWCEGCRPAAIDEEFARGAECL